MDTILSLFLLVLYHAEIVHGAVVFCDSVNYTIISDTRRSTALRSKQPHICDKEIIVDDHWYRFKSAAGNTIPTVNPGKQRCGAYVPIWFQGTHPSTENLVVDGKACAAIPFYQPPGCGISFSIKVVKCPGDFYLYRLKKPAGCGYAYCAGDKIVSYSPITDTPLDVVPMDVSTKLSATRKPKFIDVVTTSKQIYNSAGARFASTVIHTASVAIPMGKLAAILKTKSTDVVTESELYEILPRVRVLQSYSSAGDRIPSPVLHSPSENMPMKITTKLAATVKTKSTDVVTTSELYGGLPKLLLFDTLSGDMIASSVIHTTSMVLDARVSATLPLALSANSTEVVKPLISTLLPSSTVADVRVSTTLPLSLSTNSTEVVKPLTSTVLPSSTVGDARISTTPPILLSTNPAEVVKPFISTVSPSSTVADLDECNEALDDCHQNATCTNTPGSYVCECAKGLIGDGKQKCSRPGPQVETSGSVLSILGSCYTTFDAKLIYYVLECYSKSTYLELC